MRYRFAPEALLVLGGAGRYVQSRIDRLIEEYEKDPALVVLSGSHSGQLGRQLPIGQKKECDSMYDLIPKDIIPGGLIYREGKSLDTLGNMYFSNLEIPPKLQRVGVITDKFQMERSLWLFKKVMPDKTSIPMCSSQDNPLIERSTQFARLWAMKLDLLNVRDGDLPRIKDYMQTRHPFYSENPRFSWFGLLCTMQKKAGLLKGRL